MRQKQYILLTFVVVCMCLAPVAAIAQADQSATSQSPYVPPEEHKLGNYVAAGSIEAGYRFVNVNGANFNCGSPGGVCNYQGMWDTLENLRQGPRVFAQSLSLRAEGNTGVLFDNLYTSSFGWGGDPENVARLRMNKRKAYNLTVLFRRDYSLYDYNLLANPLNPSSSAPNPANPFTSAQLTSPHSLNVVRRMTDIGLQIMPQSKISFRLGYNHVKVDTPSDFTFSTFHMPMGTDIQQNQFYNYTNNGFTAGVDLKFIPRTTISFDGIVNWYKNDTNWSLLNFPVVIAGVPANEGISWNTLANQPCAVANLGTVRCNQGTSFFRSDRYRSTAPVVMATVESHYWQRLDFSAKAVYGWSDMNGAFTQNWTGRVSTSVAQAVTNNPVANNLLTTSVAAGATFHITDHIRLSDTFNFVNQRYPLFGVNFTTTTPGTTAGTATGPATTVATGISNGLFLDTKMNETMVEFDIGRHAGVNIGFRYTHRIIDFTGQGFDVDPTTGERISPVEVEAGFDKYTIPEYSGIGGVWFQPSSKFRINADVDLSSAGIDFQTFDPTTTPVTNFSISGLTTFTRITPRHQQQYRVRATFQPQRHVTMTASANIQQQSNNLSTIEYSFHNRNYGATANISPNSRISIDVGYNYQNYLQNALICFVASGTPATGSFPGTAVGAAGACPFVAAPYLGVGGDYSNQVNFGSVMVRVKPIKRVTLSVGYSIVSNDGTYTQTNGLQPTGPINMMYQRPVGAAEIDMLHGLALIGSYNYYDYNEPGSNTTIPGSGGPTTVRNFHANTGTIGLRYSF